MPRKSELLAAAADKAAKQREREAKKAERERRRQEKAEEKGKQAEMATGLAHSGNIPPKFVKKTAESDGKTENEDAPTSSIKGAEPFKPSGPCHLLRLDENSLAHCMSFFTARTLGALMIASRYFATETVGKMMLKHVVNQTRNLRALEVDEFERAEEMCRRGLDSGKNLIEKELAKLRKKVERAANAKGVPIDPSRPFLTSSSLTFPSYARFLEEAIQLHTPLRVGGEADSLTLPKYTNGRFASVSPEHTVIRAGGGGRKGGGSGALTFGVGRRGQLGHGNREDLMYPKLLGGGVGHAVRVIQVAAGGGLVRVAHTLLLTDTGRVLAFGTAGYGQLGHGFSAGKQLPDENRPRYIEALGGMRVTCVAAGELHSAAVNSDGDLYTWGEGFCGQLGTGDKRPQLTPKKIENDLEYECCQSVSCGSRQTLVLSDDGEVFSTGLGWFGVLGRSFTPFEFGANDSRTGIDEVIDEEDGIGEVVGEVVGGVVDAAAQAAENNATPPPPPAATAAAAAMVPPVTPEDSTSANHAFLTNQQNAELQLLSNLTLDDNSDQCVFKKIDSLEGVKIVGISVGHRHVLALDCENKVYSWGSGGGGALGHGDLIQRNVPERIDEFVHLKESVINISAGVDTSMCVTEKGEVFAWGRTKNGRIGLGMSEGNITQPRRLYLSPEYEGRALCVETGYVHSLIVVATGETLICGGVGVNDDVDGAAKGDDGKPRLIEAQEERLVNIWQRQNEILVKKEEVKWEKYGKYETKGRRAMMEEAKRWGV